VGSTKKTLVVQVIGTGDEAPVPQVKGPGDEAWQQSCPFKFSELLII